MPIERTTPQEAIEARIRERLQRLHFAVLRQLSVIGEKCLNVARQTNSYKDRTGNLRSSLGYVIVYDGRIAFESGFQVVKQGNEGATSGADYARRLAAQHPDGYALIVVAGKEYAAYVSARGFDVLDSAELTAERETARMMQKLKLK